MLNVDKVYTSQWIPLDNVRDYVMEKVNGFDASVALSDAQKTALYNALNTSVTEDYLPTAPFMDYADGSGVVLPDYASCRDVVIDYYKAALGEDIDTTSETHVGRMIEQSTLIFRSALGFAAANVMQMDLNCAMGRYLDALASLFFLQRKSAIATSVTANITNTTAATIYMDTSGGSNSVKDASGNVYALSASVSVAANSTQEIKFVCNTKGTIVPDQSQLTWTLVDGLTGANAFSSTSLGYDIESDLDFKNRVKNSRYASVGFMESVKSTLLSISGVYDVYGIENTSNETATIAGVSLSAHSIVIYVDFDGISTTQDEIAEGIFSHKAIGCGYTTISDSSKYGTAYSIVVRDENFGTSYTVKFYSPKSVPVYVDVEVTRHEYSGQDLAKEIKEAIVAWANGDVPYVDGIKIGQDVKAYEIGAAISDKIPEIQIDNVEVGTSSSPSATRVTINAYQLATISQDNITVTIN